MEHFFFKLQNIDIFFFFFRYEKYVLCVVVLCVVIRNASVRLLMSTHNMSILAHQIKSNLDLMLG